MRKSKFSEEQIIAILAEQERGMATILVVGGADYIGSHVC